MFSVVSTFRDLIDHEFPICCNLIRTTMRYANGELNECVNSSEYHSSSYHDETRYPNNACCMSVNVATDLNRIIDSDGLNIFSQEAWNTYYSF